MKRAVDTNVLVVAHIASATHHARVRRYLVAQLAQPDVTLIVTPLILHEFVHIITDARRFAPPVSMHEATAIARLYLEHSNIECLSTDRDAIALALTLLEKHQLGRKRIADTLFAATLLGNDVREIVTCNPSDFAVFNVFALADPTADEVLASTSVEG